MVPGGRRPGMITGPRAADKFCHSILHSIHDDCRSVSPASVQVKDESAGWIRTRIPSGNGASGTMTPPCTMPAIEAAAAAPVWAGVSAPHPLVESSSAWRGGGLLSRKSVSTSGLQRGVALYGPTRSGAGNTPARTQRLSVGHRKSLKKNAYGTTMSRFPLQGQRAIVPRSKVTSFIA